jgi:Cu/Ag efflux pump CusA
MTPLTGNDAAKCRAGVRRHLPTALSHVRQRARLATLIFFKLPFAAVGGIFALALRGMPFSISAAVGFIALFGIAILHCVVMVSYMEERRKEGLAAWQAAMTRLLPVLMTATVASLGFLPWRFRRTPAPRCSVRSRPSSSAD